MPPATHINWSWARLSRRYAGAFLHMCAVPLHINDIVIAPGTAPDGRPALCVSAYGIGYQPLYLYPNTVEYILAQHPIDYTTSHETIKYRAIAAYVFKHNLLYEPIIEQL